MALLGKRGWLAWCAVGGLAVTFALGAPAFACTTLVSLTVSPASVGPGGSMTLVGSAFVPPGAGGGAISLSVVDRSDDLVEQAATVTPNANGSFSTSMVAPSVSPGPYLVVASQYDLATGRYTPFTPVRALFTIAGTPVTTPAVPITTPANSSGTLPPITVPGLPTTVPTTAAPLAVSVPPAVAVPSQAVTPATYTTSAPPVTTLTSPVTASATSAPPPTAAPTTSPPSTSSPSTSPPSTPPSSNADSTTPPGTTGTPQSGTLGAHKLASQSSAAKPGSPTSVLWPLVGAGAFVMAAASLIVVRRKRLAVVPAEVDEEDLF